MSLDCNVSTQFWTIFICSFNPPSPLFPCLSSTLPFDVTAACVDDGYYDRVTDRRTPQRRGFKRQRQRRRRRPPPIGPTQRPTVLSGASVTTGSVLACRVVCLVSFESAPRRSSGGFLFVWFFSLHSFASILPRNALEKKKRFKFDDGAVVFGVVAIEQVLILWRREKKHQKKNRFSILIFRAIAIESQISSRPWKEEKRRKENQVSITKNTLVCDVTS